MAKRRKRKGGLLSGLVVVLCVLIILPVLSLTVNLGNFFKLDKEVVIKDEQLYYEVSFVVNGCFSSVDSIYVRYGEVPVLPVPECDCEHLAYDEEKGEIITQHSFAGWSYEGQRLTQANCPAFNTNVVLVATYKIVAAPITFIDFPLEWLE